MKCHYFLNNHCLSCDLLSEDYLSSIKSKEQKLAFLFPEHADKIKPSVKCKASEGSRNKAKLAVALVDEQIEFGFHHANKQFRELENCPLHAPDINNILSPLKDLLHTYKIQPYDLFLRKGELKYILISYSESTHELLLRFVLRSTACIPHLKKLSTDLLAQHPSIKVITANIQPIHQAILEGEEEIVLTERDCITHQFENYFLLQGPRSFFQTSSDMALQLYSQFQKELSALPIHSLLDLYCGVGAFSFYATKYCEKVTGVEISDAAILYARKACEFNKTLNIDFLAMDAEDYLTHQHENYFDAILVNPPRRGLNENIISHLLRLKPKYLFYSSCNAETLHRDFLQLKQYYQIQSLQIFDMFPFTSHFETLVVLSKI